ncbi:NRDE family protein [Halobium salinum]|uniref:NRDE family protein n=1 Tax=Halobium salinum TaxID=1364940 RepID=A0ABD5PH88_9EURY|nr:NRDE family protein [Halobium salinum]
MCTLTLAWQVFEDAPVVVAANRDEALDRPSEPPRARDFDGTAVVAPADAQAGGTWVGYNEHGLFVGVTNRWVGGLAAERSRGLLVRDALRQGSADAAVRMVEDAVADHEYDGFNLVVADAESATLLEWDGHLHVREYAPGVHVVVNVGTDDSFFVPDRRPEAGRQQAENARTVREALDPRAGETADDWLDRAADVLGDHEYGVCVHGVGYGTVSSCLIRLGRDGSRRYEFAPGPPCTTDFDPVEDPV